MMETTTIQANVNDSFRNLLEFRSWANKGMESLSSINAHFKGSYTRQDVEARIRKSADWFGHGATADEILAGITQFKNPGLLDSILRQVDEAIPAATTARMKMPKMEFNDRGMGLFSFDRAATGIFRLKELHSPSLGRVVEQDECVETDGTWTLKSDGSEVVERWEQRPDGRPKAHTVTKRVFACFPRRDKEREAVEIYISCGGNARLSAQQMLYSGLGAVAFAQILTLSRIPTKISVVIGSMTDLYQSAYLSIVPVKDYGETLDSNLIALLSSDPRFYRHDGFKGIIATFDHFGRRCPFGLGKALTRDAIVRCIEDSTYTTTAKLAPNRFYFGGTYSGDSAVAQVTEAIETLAQKLLK